MTINELLQKLFNATDEQVNSFAEEMKANKIFTASEENMDIRHSKLKTQHESTTKQLEEAQALIETLKKSTKGHEDAQQKITAYEQREKELLAELEKKNKGVKHRIFHAMCKAELDGFKLNGRYPDAGKIEE